MTLEEVLAPFSAITFKQAMAVIMKFGDQKEFTHRPFETDFYGLKYKGHTQNLIDRHVFFLGSYEAGILNLMKKLLVSDPNSVFIDIGANVGVHTLFASLYAKKVFAFEPFEKVRSILEGHISANNIKNVEIVPWALGEKNQTLEFFLPPEHNLGTGSFIKDLHPDNYSANLQLEIYQASEAFEKMAIKSATIIKIDTEGGEYVVLCGLLEFLKKNKPTIIFEYCSNSFNGFNSANPVTDFLNEHYTLRALKAVNAFNVMEVPWSPDSFGNVLCIPKKF